MSRKACVAVFLFVLLAVPFVPAFFSSNVAEAQEPSVPSTVWREYPYIASHLVENTTHYVYVTDWGNYSFSKTLPYVCLYTYRNGETMISFSTFWINTSSMLVPLNPTVLTANDTYFKVQVDAYKLTTKMATIVQEWNFNRTDKPKISVTLTKTANWNLGDFNIFWIVAGYQYVKQNETSTINCSQTMSYWKKDVKVEMGSSLNVSDWREWLVVDWGDEGVADVWLGQFSIFGFSLAAVKVDFTVNDGQIDPSYVGTSVTAEAVSYPFQRKGFYANGRFWAFYSDGTNMVYRTSTDGSTWSAATTVRTAAYGYTFSIWFDGTYLHYAYAGGYIYYRRGTPNADGTITWSAAEQTVSTKFNSASYPMVSVDSNGYVWIGYIDYDSSNTVYYPFVIKSGNNDGTWGTTPSGFPYQPTTDSSSVFGVSVIPLTSGKMLAVYAYTVTVKARKWDGSAWGTEVATTSAIYYGFYHSAVAQGDDVHIVFFTSGSNIIYVKYTYSTNSFGTETTLQAGSSNLFAPMISINPSTNDLYVFWTGYPTANHIYYRKYTGSTGTWETAVDWMTETETLTDDARNTCFYQAGGNTIGLLYRTNAGSPFNVKFAFLTLNQAPTIGQFQAPSGRISINSYFYLNATVNDANGVNDLQNATLTLNYTINLNWFNSTNTFTKTGDANNYCTLGSGSTRTTINSTAYKLSWNISLSIPLSWHVVSAVVFDSAGSNGTSSAANMFITDGLKLTQYVLDLASEVVYVQVVYAYDSQPIANANVSYAGLYASTNNTGWAAFNVSTLANVNWNSVSFGVSEPTYGLTYPAQNQTVAFHKLQVQPFTVRANNFIGNPVWDDANRKLTFTTSGTCIVKVGDWGTPLRVEVDNTIYTDWTYDSAKQEVAINNLASNVALYWQQQPSGGAPGGSSGGVTPTPGETPVTPTPPPVYVPPEAVPLVNVGLVVIVVVVVGAYAYSQVSKPQTLDQAWRKRQPTKKKGVTWKRRGRYD